MFKYQLFVLINLCNFVWLQNQTPSILELLSALAERNRTTVAIIKPIADSLVENYLIKYGYITPTIKVLNNYKIYTDVSGLMDNKLLANPIKRFQQFSGLPVTGELDNSTLIKLNTPRCGVEDVNLDTKTKRASVNTWNKNLIKYFIKDFSTKLTDDEVRAGLSEAWNVWSVVTPLKFQEVGPSEKRDVVVRFAELSHGDAFPFDGPGGVLGHSLLVGDMLHLDNAENWKYVKTGDRILSSQIDFLNIAIHEIGHVLGLKHSPDKDSIMTPFYRTSNSLNYKKPALSDSDIRVIQSMYGVRNEITTTTPVPRPFPLGSSDTLRTYLTAFPDLAATINFSGSDGYRDSLTNFLKQYEIWYSKQT